MIFFENLHRFKNKLFNRKNLRINKDIDFGSKSANLFFKDKLKKSKFYFEFGSGSSTLLADINGGRYISVELDKLYFDLVKKRIRNKKIKFVDLGPVGEFSYPLIKNKKKILNYIKTIDDYFKKKDYPDFILIDGRFRVACCINLFFLIKKFHAKTTILLDDYQKREHYKILNDFFKVKRIGRMAVLKIKKKNFNKNLIYKYIFDSR